MSSSAEKFSEVCIFLQFTHSNGNGQRVTRKRKKEKQKVVSFGLSRLIDWRNISNHHVMTIFAWKWSYDSRPMACNVFFQFFECRCRITIIRPRRLLQFSSLSSSFQSSSGDIRTEAVQSFATNEIQPAPMSHWATESQRKSPRHMKAWKVLKLKKIRH